MTCRQYVPIKGKRVFLLSAGQGDAIVFLHGLGGWAEHWLAQMTHFSTTHTVIAPDIIGFGRSEALHDECTMESLARFVCVLLDELDVKECYLAGNSFGSAIAVEFCRRYKDRVKGLIMSNCPAVGKEIFPSFRLLSVPGMGELAAFPNPISTRLEWETLVHNKQILTEDFLTQALRIARLNYSKGNVLAVIRRYANVFGLKELIGDRLSQIEVPTLIVWGRDDRIVPVAHAYAAHDMILGSELRIIKDCGHIPQMERPEEFNAAAQKFVART